MLRLGPGPCLGCLSASVDSFHRPCSISWKQTSLSCKRPRSSERISMMRWSSSLAGTSSSACPSTRRVWLSHFKASNISKLTSPRILWRRHLHTKLQVCPDPSRRGGHWCPYTPEVHDQVSRSPSRSANWWLPSARPARRHHRRSHSRLRRPLCDSRVPGVCALWRVQSCQP